MSILKRRFACTLGLAVGAAALFSTLAPAHAEDDSLRQKQTQACKGDALKLCALAIPNEKKIPSKIIDHYDICIDPLNVVEQYRNKPDNPYEALLNELYDKYGKEKYFEKLPPGMLVMLIGRYMKEVCRPNDRVIITDFPNTIQDAIKFENEVSVISKILVPNASTESDICKYYQTVNKVKEL